MFFRGKVNARSAIAALSFMMAACASAPGNGNLAEPQAATRPVPSKIGIVEHTESELLPRAAGMVHRYRDGRFRPDVYVYDAEGSGSTRVQAYEFIESLKFRRVFGRSDAFRVRLDGPITVSIDDRNFEDHEIVAQIHGRGQWYDTYFSVIAVGDEFVKFRIAQPRSDQTADRSREFVQAWLAAYLSGESK